MMKKIITLTMLLVIAMTANAQETESYRKTWDFTKGFSATTIAALQADFEEFGAAGHWRDYEKDATLTGGGQGAFWSADGGVPSSEEGYAVTYSGDVATVIPELEGLTLGGLGAKKVVIAYNYKQTENADSPSGMFPYGSSFLWINGGKVSFNIKNVKKGETLRVGLESHKNSEGRGINIAVDGTTIAQTSGNNTPTYFNEVIWDIPDDTPDVDDYTDVKVTTTSGCHIYYIIVGEGDTPEVETAKEVAYIYNTSVDMDMIYTMISATDILNVTAIDIATKPTLETLAKYDVVALAPSLTSDDAATVKSLIAFIPVVNFNTGLYGDWGYGISMISDTNTLTVKDTKNPIFEDLDVESGLEFLQEGEVTGVMLGDYFAEDDTLAMAGNVVAMHTHNPGRNAYYLIPLGTEQMGAEAIYTTLIPKTMVAASKTKRELTAVGTPNITVEQADGFSTVTIKATSSKAIYYTVDGSDPTTASTLYTEPFDVTVATTVKAFATGDGYTDSQIASKDVTIASQAATPEIAMERQEGKTIVTLTSTDAGAVIYYNFAGQSTETASVKYTEPFEVTTPAMLTVFAGAAENVLASETAQKFIVVNGINKDNIRWDVVAHFDANKDNWAGKGQQTDESGNIINANYFFTWGKSAGKYWDETSEQVQKTDENGNLVYEEDGVTPVMVYTKTLDPETYEAEGWKIVSIGQVMTWEALNIGWDIGDTSMRNPDTAEDAIGVNDEMGITANAVTFGKQPSDGPFNASLESTVAFAGPFDVVIYAGNGNDGEIPTMQVETSTDGLTWTKLGDVDYSLIKRNWKKTVLSFEETSSVYVRILHTAAKSSGQIYDLYIMNNGEKSKQYNEETVGITEVRNNTNAKAAGIYTINGVRVQQLTRGLNIVVSQDGKVRKVMVK